MKTPPCKITVVKRYLNKELIGAFIEESHRDIDRCDMFEDGQEFVLSDPWRMPEGFCPWAWADIRKDIMFVVCGGVMPGMKDQNVLISGCSDWFRPVIFKIERLEGNEESA